MPTVVDNLIAGTLWLHVPAGVLGVLVFWVPLVATKGGRLHRRAGWVFAASMLVAGISAMILSALRFAQAASAPAGLTLAAAVTPLFFFNVGLLTLTSVHHALRVLRQKGRTAPHQGTLDFALVGALIACSTATMALGVATRSVLLFTIPVIGVALGTQFFLTLCRRPRERMFWWFQHMIGMFSGCIAAITAALVVNAGRVQSVVPLPAWLVWMGPTLLLVPILVAWISTYRRTFARDDSPSPASDAGA
ncbi:MAG: hypothetical protein AB7K52_02750 [Phycisphaerales bacterium]